MKKIILIINMFVIVLASTSLTGYMDSEAEQQLLCPRLLTSDDISFDTKQILHSLTSLSEALSVLTAKLPQSVVMRDYGRRSFPFVNFSIQMNTAMQLYNPSSNLEYFFIYETEIIKSIQQTYFSMDYFFNNSVEQEIIEFISVFSDAELASAYFWIGQCFQQIASMFYQYEDFERSADAYFKAGIFYVQSFMLNKKDSKDLFSNVLNVLEFTQRRLGLSYLPREKNGFYYTLSPGYSLDLHEQEYNDCNFSRHCMTIKFINRDRIIAKIALDRLGKPIGYAIEGKETIFFPSGDAFYDVMRHSAKVENNTLVLRFYNKANTLVHTKIIDFNARERPGSVLRELGQMYALEKSA